jgi:hypothetical protein
MAEVVPSFDSLMIIKQSQGWIAKYVVKSRSINYSVNLERYVELSNSNSLILADLNEYLKSLNPRTAFEIDKEGPKPEPIGNSREIIFTQFYNNEMTFRTIPDKEKGLRERILRNLTLPVRENIKQQIKIPYLTISENIKGTVDSLIIAIDQLASSPTE